MQNLDQEEWRRVMEQAKEPVIIDVRTPYEIDQGYIPGALHINIQDAGSFMGKIAELDKTKDYFVYCRAGSRSAQACMIMESQGFEKTYNLAGGFDRWMGERTT
jgi:rhodanese-related sulfurtransferase